MISDRLLKLRKDKGCTQQEVADYLDINRVSYARFEGGKVEPSKNTLIKLAKYFDCTTDYILGLSENPKEISNLTDEEREFLDAYAKAKQSDQEDIKDLLRIIDKKLNKDEG